MTPPITLNDLPITWRAEIPADYLDEMRHMNVMWYTHLFSQASWGLFKLIGFGHDTMAERNTGSFALEMHVRYLAEVRVGQHVTVRSRALAQSAKRIHYQHFLSIDEADDRLSATAEIVSAHVDMSVRRQSPIPDDIAAQYAALLAAHQALAWPAPLCGTMHA